MKKASDVKLICSVLTGKTDLFDTFRSALSSEFGPIDLESDLFQFNYTNYYEKEMGPNLSRKIYGFENLVDPGTIADIKLRTIVMEKELAERIGADVDRVVNFDPGYVSTFNLVLATTKDRPHRIYLRDGIYAEVTLEYIKGGFQSTPSTYPDYCLPEYGAFFDDVREGLRSSR
jgi:hypothetical protein